MPQSKIGPWSQQINIISVIVLYLRVFIAVNVVKLAESSKGDSARFPAAPNGLSKFIVRDAKR